MKSMAIYISSHHHARTNVLSTIQLYIFVFPSPSRHNIVDQYSLHHVKSIFIHIYIYIHVFVYFCLFVSILTTFVDITLIYI
ncbi:hypothetical protein IC582_015295 [Cucumis melo]